MARRQASSLRRARRASASPCAIRARGVVEGCGSNGCEYMTGGTAVILGPVGENFGAGMTGGMAFLYDPLQRFETMANPETIIWRPVVTEHWSHALRDTDRRACQAHGLAARQDDPGQLAA